MIDGHVHVWSLDEARYPWRPTLAHVPIPTTPASAEMLLEAMDGAGVSHAVLVQPSVYGWNNAYLSDCLRRWPTRFAGVCLVDPRNPDAARQLERCIRDEGCRGVRINLIAEADSGWLLAPEQAALWETAARLDASVSLQMLPRHAETVATLAARHPAAVFIVDYLGPAAFHDGSGGPALARLAALANVHYKILALGQDSRLAFPFADLHPLYGEAYRLFGADRLIFGTDFPHVLGQGSYADGIGWLDTLPFLDAAARRRVADENARRLWRLAH